MYTNRDPRTNAGCNPRQYKHPHTLLFPSSPRRPLAVSSYPSPPLQPHSQASPPAAACRLEAAVMSVTLCQASLAALAAARGTSLPGRKDQQGPQVQNRQRERQADGGPAWACPAPLPDSPPPCTTLSDVPRAPVFHPTEPSSFSDMSWFTSAANSIGSSLNTSRQNPLMMVATASSGSIPLCWK